MFYAEPVAARLVKTKSIKKVCATVRSAPVAWKPPDSRKILLRQPPTPSCGSCPTSHISTSTPRLLSTSLAASRRRLPCGKSKLINLTISPRHLTMFRSLPASQGPLYAYEEPPGLRPGGFLRFSGLKPENPRQFEDGFLNPGFRKKNPGERGFEVLGFCLHW